MTSDPKGPQFVRGTDRPKRYSSDFTFQSETLGMQEALEDLPYMDNFPDVQMGEVIVDTYGETFDTVDVYGGQTLGGYGPVWRSNSSPLTRIKLGDGVNKDMIHIRSLGAGSPTQYFPCVRWLHLDGNKANNPTGGSCIYADEQTLDLYILGVITSYAKEDGIHFNNGNIKAWVKDCYAEYHDRNFMRLTNHFITYIDYLYTYDSGAQGLYINRGTTHLSNSTINAPRGNGFYYGGGDERQLKMSNVNVWGCGSLDATNRFLFDTYNPSNLLASNCQFGERDISTPDRSKGIFLQGPGTKNVRFVNCSFDALRDGFNPFELSTDFPLSELSIENCGGTSWRGVGTEKYIYKEYYDFYGILIDSNKWHVQSSGNGVDPVFNNNSLGELRFRVTAGLPGTSEINRWGALRFSYLNNPHMYLRCNLNDVTDGILHAGFVKDADEYCRIRIEDGDIYLESDDAGVQGPYSEDSGINVGHNTWVELLIETLPTATGRFKINGQVYGTPTVGAVTTDNMQPQIYVENKNNGNVDGIVDYCCIRQGRNLW